MAHPDYPIHLIERRTSNSEDLGPEFWQIQDPPDRVFAQGTAEALALLKRLPKDGLAVVGTREPQARSIQMTQDTVLELADSPIIIISGFARGIDATAHTAAIKAGLPTIAILGCGLDVKYPQEHAALRVDILKRNGLLISEFPRGYFPRKSSFLQRNRLIAGWAKATWIVEAGVRSGALNTAKWAREQHRYCFATPCFPGDVALTGCQNLIDHHHALPLWGAHSLGTAWLELSTRGTQAGKLNRLGLALPPGLTPQESALIAQVNYQTSGQGGIQVPELLEWTISQGWSPQAFFLALQRSLGSGAIEDHEGTLVISSAFRKPA